MSLKQEVRDWLLKKIFRDKGRPKAKKAVAAGSNPFLWSVLVLDSTTLRIVQSCFQRYELGLKELSETRYRAVMCCTELDHSRNMGPSLLSSSIIVK